ncbi:MAG: alkyl sulfatase dimerization domain-containing protein [Pseudomonadota bacterium]
MGDVTRRTALGLALVAATPAVIAPTAARAREDIAPAAPAPGLVTETTKTLNAALGGRLDLARDLDQERATRGKLARIEADAIRGAQGNVVWPIAQFDFLKGPAPDTVNPSLWRQAQLAAEHGLFEVTDGLWQVRGYDLAVMSVIRGDTGWIIIDPLTTAETSAAALKLVQETLGERPVSALIYTHSHADHYGGARGVLTEEEIAARGVPVIAPFGFLENAVAEQLLAGNHMGRRATLMFGSVLPRNPEGHVSSGLGPALSTGTLGLLPPTVELSQEIQTRVIDGVAFEFMDAAETEAPAEFIFYLPEKRALCTSEVVCATFHNILTPRGAKARNALRWSRVIDDALVRWGDVSDVTFASHHWPVWGTDEVKKRLTAHRDMYRFIHDQTLRLANAGETMFEVAEKIEEPAVQSEEMTARNYYGTLNHNSKAVYQYYFGWWGGVPADYYALPATESAPRYVEAMGGADRVLTLGVEAYEAGDYRWAAELLNKVVFADPESRAAREWLAASYEQIGYQAESGAWRSYYLGAASELRDGVPDAPPPKFGSADFLDAVDSRDLLDALAARFNPAKMAREPFALNFVFPDRDEAMSVEVGAATVTPRSAPAEGAAAKLTLSRADLDLVLLRQKRLVAMVPLGEATVEGDLTALMSFFGALDQPEFWFNTATP